MADKEEINIEKLVERAREIQNKRTLKAEQLQEDVVRAYIDNTEKTTDENGHTVYKFKRDKAEYIEMAP